MAIFMQDRLRSAALVWLLSWLVAGRSSVADVVLRGGASLYSGWYMYLLWKTFKGAVVAPMFWGPLSSFVVSRYLTYHEFFRADGASEELAAKREKALRRLSQSWKERFGKAEKTSDYLLKRFSDLRFKASGVESMYPIFQKVVTEHLDMLTVVESSDGNELTDVCGEKYLDCSGSYGVNCFGYTRSKEFLAAGQKLASQLGPCLGPMHPVVAENIEMLLKIFRKEECSFHMSGTEAIMSAVYQARFHTQRPLIAVFQGAYHGWWDGVMQGAGQGRYAFDCLILKDQDDTALELLKARSGEVAAVIINPITGFAWKNAGTAKMGFSKVDAGEDSINRFRAWLQKVRTTCSRHEVPLIFDETWAFHLGQGGAQDLYGVEADMLVLGKSLGGGHAVGAVLGPSRLMERRDVARPMRVNFVVGTFKGNPVVMGSMNAVLKWVTTLDAKKAFDGLKDRVAKWVTTCNATLEKKDLPIRVAAHRTTWCICYQTPSLYHFMFMYYLRDAGLQMAWVGTSKMLFNLEFSEADLTRLTGMIVKAAVSMQADGWWENGGKKVSLVPLILGPSLKYHLAPLLKKVGVTALG